MILLLPIDRYNQLDKAIATLGDSFIELDYQQISDLLNAPTIEPNPVPRPTVPAGSVFDAIKTLATASGGLDPVDIKALAAANSIYKTLQDTGAALNSPVASTELFLSILSTQKMSPQGKISFEAEAKKTQPDPNWEPTIVTPAALQPPATPEDIQAYFADRESYAAMVEGDRDEAQ